uniref:Cytochrome P450 family 26 subfamily C member 1 n=1 Tax=Varanus komodoensis TaxID=61221 RepID=A0A8D2IQ62_VARKO
IAAQILLGLRLDEKTFQELAQTFEQLMENLFSLPLNIPFSGLRKGIKARDLLHEYMEKAIMEKLQWKNPEAPSDGLDFIISSAKEHGKEFTMQELKVIKKASFGCWCVYEAGRLLSSLERPECYCQPNLTLEKMSRLRYLDCVIKEVLRLLPPVSGGYRTALQTFELNGYQIPKGWSVMYSIRDTHETTSIYQSPPDSFDPERFWTSQEGQEEHKVAGSTRFHYIPFGGGVRNCIGKELAQTILKLLAIELVSTAHWELATVHFPKMQTVPIVHPVDGLQLYFHPLKPGRKSNKANT